MIFKNPINLFNLELKTLLKSLLEAKREGTVPSRTEFILATVQLDLI